jgi:hypothetical protein
MASATPSANVGPSQPIFRSLFQFGERTQPVSSTVRELWGNSSSLTSVASASSVASATSFAPATPAGSTSPVAPAALPAQPKASGPQGLDLFSDRSGTFSG